MQPDTRAVAQGIAGRSPRPPGLCPVGRRHSRSLRSAEHAACLSSQNPRGLRAIAMTRYQNSRPGKAEKSGRSMKAARNKPRARQGIFGSRVKNLAGEGGFARSQGLRRRSRCQAGASLRTALKPARDLASHNIPHFRCMAETFASTATGPGRRGAPLQGCDTPCRATSLLCGLRHHLVKFLGKR